MAQLQLAGGGRHRYLARLSGLLVREEYRMSRLVGYEVRSDGWPAPVLIALISANFGRNNQEQCSEHLAARSRYTVFNTLLPGSVTPVPRFAVLIGKPVQ